MICKVCNENLNEFNFSKRKNGVYRSECKECKRKYAIEYRKGKSGFDNPFIINKEIPLNKTCNICNEVKPIEEFIKGKRKCVDCRKKLSKIYYLNNKEERIDKSKEFYIKNSEYIRERVSIYNKNNREVVNKRNRMYRKEVLSKDPLWSIKRSISSYISRAVKLKSIVKDFKSQDTIGCSILELKSHIENLFLPEMSWVNRNKWHIDHMIPLDLAIDKEEVIILNHYTNLRPMWAKENILKSNKIEDDKHPIYLKIMIKRGIIF